MNIYDIVRKIQMLINSPTMSIVDRANFTSNFIKEFEDNFKIVPKEEWCVIFNKEDVGGKLVVGGFFNEGEAKRYKDGWYKKQEEYIESVLATNPESNISCSTYLTIGKVEELLPEDKEWFSFDNEKK